MYLDSTKVKVFPTAYRGKTIDSKIFDPESRLNTEKNLTKIATKITSHDSFVVNRDFELSSGETEKLEVCLKGYLFELTLTPNDLSDFETSGKVYAKVKVEAKNPDYASDTTNTEYEGLSLSPFNEGQNILDDSNGDFIGLDLSSTMESGEDSLLILEYKNNKWIVPTSSILSLDTKIVEDGLNSGKSIREEFHTGELHTGELHTGDVWVDNIKADTNEHWGLQIDDEGNISNIDLYQDWNTEQDGYDFIDGIEFDSRGMLINVHHTTIPDASLSKKGLVTTEEQAFKGSKHFFDPIYANQIRGKQSSEGDIALGITNPNGNITLQASGDDGGNINLNPGISGKVKYNGEEIATKYWVEQSAIANKAKKLGNTFGNYNVGNNQTPIYFYNGEPAKCRYSMVGEHTYSTNIWVDISDSSPSATDSNSPGSFSYTASNELIVDSAYLCGIADDDSSATSSKGSGTLSLCIRKYPNGTFKFIDNKWLHINLNSLINNYFSNYYFTTTAGIIQEENLSFKAHYGPNSTVPGNKIWLILSGPDLYIGVIGDGYSTTPHEIYSLNIILYGSLTKRN